MSYYNISEVETATLNLAAAFPTLCSLLPLPFVTVGGHTCHALRLGGGTPGTREVFTIVGNHHAREWGSCEILLNFATDLLTAYTGNTGLAYGGTSFTAAQVKGLLDTLHIVVFPMINPDGRDYSQNHEALWRKNRNPANSGGNPACVGIDLNRNYDFLFDFTTAFAPGSGVSVSSNPCDHDVYQGPHPFSEAETQNVKWLLDSFPTTRWYVDVHSFSEDILYSWGDDEDQTTDPSMNFLNPAFDGQRGKNGDAYKEFIPSNDLAIIKRLTNRFVTDLNGVRNKAYTAMSSFSLYPTSGASDDYAFSRHRVDPGKGKVYAFVIEWGAKPVDGSTAAEIAAFQPAWTEMENIIKDVSAGLIGMCLSAPCGDGVIGISLQNPAIIFTHVPAGIETSRAAVFSVESCAAVDLSVTSGPTVSTGPGAFHLPLGNPPPLPSAPSDAERLAYVWVSFKGTNPGDVTTGTMTVKCTQTGDTFVIPIHANTVAQPSVASMLVLDQSGSMDDPSGVPGQKRIDVLHAAAPDFVNLLPDIDGVGVVSFDQVAYPRTPVVSGPAGRTAANAAISAHVTNPAGTTSIGNGVELAHNEISSVSGYTDTAIVVFTDGEENTYKFISDVRSLITDRVFAIGLGTAQEVNPVALNALVNDTGGYLLLTDQLGPNDNLRLAKYFVQISAGVTNAEVVVDPEGILPPGLEFRIPFDLNESDYGSDVIVLSPAPWAFEFQLETPAGIRIAHNSLGGVLGVQFAAGAQMSFYRLSLPVVASGASAQQGRWHIVLKVLAKNWKKYLRTAENAPASARLGVPYSAVVHARSSLAMQANLTQPSYVPATTLNLRAVLTEIGLPVQGRASVHAQVRRPDGTQLTLDLPEVSPGVFLASTPAPIAGVYPVHFRATGKTLRGFPFSREQLRTGMAWSGGDAPPPRGKPSTGSWCEFLKCLLSDKGIQQWLAENRVDPRKLESCLAKTLCKPESQTKTG